MKKYYVVYASKDINYYYDTVSWVVCIIEDESVAKDLCRKFDYSYATEIVGEDRTTPSDVRSKEPKEIV